MNEESEENGNLSKRICDINGCPGHDDYIVICGVCGEVFNSLVKIRLHKQEYPQCRHRKKKVSEINESQTHVCMLCEETFSSEARLKEHVLRHTFRFDLYSIDCIIDYSEEELDDLFTDHVLILRGFWSEQRYIRCWEYLIPKKRIMCKTCRRLFASKATLKRHRMVLHRWKKTYECQYCGKKMHYKSGLAYHVIIAHTPTKPYSCTTCGIKFLKETQLKFHCFLKHQDKLPFHCIICKLRFGTEKKFFKHAFTHNAQLEE